MSFCPLSLYYYLIWVDEVVVQGQEFLNVKKRGTCMRNWRYQTSKRRFKTNSCFEEDFQDFLGWSRFQVNHYPDRKGTTIPLPAERFHFDKSKVYFLLLAVAVGIIVMRALWFCWSSCKTFGRTKLVGKLYVTNVVVATKALKDAPET
jgi:hypothetical protein